MALSIRGDDTLLDKVGALYQMSAKVSLAKVTELTSMFIPSYGQEDQLSVM